MAMKTIANTITVVMAPTANPTPIPVVVYLLLWYFTNIIITDSKPSVNREFEEQSMVDKKNISHLDKLGGNVYT